MCYAIPGKVETIEGNLVTLDYFGEKKQAYNELDCLRPEDFVYAQGGFVIKAIPPEEARSILSVWKETFFELQEIDLRLTRVGLEDDGADRGILRILDKALEEKGLSREKLLKLLSLKTPRERELLYKVANFLRRKYLSNSCCVHGIIEFSSYCRRNCAYCGISLHNRYLKRYRMSNAEILEVVTLAVKKHGFQSLVLQSGEDTGFPAKQVAELIREIKKRHPLLIFVSCGEVGLEELETLYEAGARGILLRFETANPLLYQRLHPGSSLNSRIEHLKRAYETGYMLITGSLVGLPGQTPEDILNDLFLARDLHAEMYSFGPFIPHPATSLSAYPPADSVTILNTLAVLRIMDPRNAKILVTTAFETIDPQAREKGLTAGANSLMLNVTPRRFRKSYSIYPHRANEDITVEEQIRRTLELLYRIGRAPTDLGVQYNRQ